MGTQRRAPCLQARSPLFPAALAAVERLQERKDHKGSPESSSLLFCFLVAVSLSPFLFLGSLSLSLSPSPSLQCRCCPLSAVGKGAHQLFRDARKAAVEAPGHCRARLLGGRHGRRPAPHCRREGHEEDRGGEEDGATHAARSDTARGEGTAAMGAGEGQVHRGRDLRVQCMCCMCDCVCVCECVCVAVCVCVCVCRPARCARNGANAKSLGCVPASRSLPPSLSTVFFLFSISPPTFLCARHCGQRTRLSSLSTQAAGAATYPNAACTVGGVSEQQALLSLSDQRRQRSAPFQCGRCLSGRLPCCLCFWPWAMPRGRRRAAQRRPTGC